MMYTKSELVELLHCRASFNIFVKDDMIRCTLNDRYISEEHRNKKQVENDDTLNIFDIDNQRWVLCQLKDVKSVKANLG